MQHHHGHLPISSPLFPALQPVGQPRPRGAPRKLTEEESVEVDFAFQQLAQIGAGGAGGATGPHTVGPRQLKTALRAMGFPVKKADVAALLRDAGYDSPDPSCNTPRIDAASFRELVGAQLASRPPGSEVARAFALFDLTGSGRVSARDLGMIAKQLMADIDPAEVADMIDVFDRDGDGAINEAEFRAIMAGADDDY